MFSIKFHEEREGDTFSTASEGLGLVGSRNAYQSCSPNIQSQYRESNALINSRPIPSARRKKPHFLTFLTYFHLFLTSIVDVPITVVDSPVFGWWENKLNGMLLMPPLILRGVNVQGEPGIRLESDYRKGIECNFGLQLLCPLKPLATIMTAG